MATDPTTPQTAGGSRLIIGLFAAAVAALAAAAIYLVSAGSLGAGGSPVASAVAIGGPFRLTDQDGQPLGSDDLKGKPFAVFFGFTRCPEICPTTLTELATLMQKLGPDADRMHFVFVSLDPTRDTPEVLKQYISVFDKRIVGLTGSEPDVAAVAKSYRVFWEKVPTANGDYTLNHSASVYLMDATGNLVGTLAYQEDMDVALTKLRRLAEAKAASL